MARTEKTRRTTQTLIALAIVAAAVTLAGCGNPATTSGGPSDRTGILVSPAVPPDASKDAGTGQVSDQATLESAAAPSTVAPQRLVVVNKTMRIETENVDAAIAKIRELVTRDGAEISNMQVATSTDQPIYRDPIPLADGTTSSSSSGPIRAFVTVRVPTAKYAGFLADAVALGKVLTESETSDDVTQQHVDMAARLGNLTAEQTRLRDMFASAKNVTDMLAVERELSRVQGEIESLKAQIAFLERQAAMATVTLELTEPPAIVQPAGIDWGVRTAVTDAIRAFVGTLNILIVILGPVLALLLFVGLPAALIVWLVVRSVRRRRARASVAAGTPSDVTQTP